MKKLAIGSFFVLFAIVGMVAAPSAFADHAKATVSIPEGSGVPGCEETDECWLPATVTVDVGGEVTWTNDDTAGHTVTDGDLDVDPDNVGANFDSGLFVGGATFTHKFESAGEFPYFCMVHPWMKGTVIVEEAMAEGEDGELMVDIKTGSAGMGEAVTIDVTFTNMDGGAVEHVNYDIMASQGTQVVLDVKGAHEHNGMGQHTTAPLPLAASDAMPLNIDVTFNGFGIDEPFTGPIGQVATKQVVPEFGTIAVVVLGVAIVSIIAISAKTKLIQRI